MPSFTSQRFVLLALVLTIALAAVACSDGETPFATVAPTSSSGQQATATPSGSGGGSTAGNAENGKTLFNTQGCSGCHSTGDDTVVGPGLAGIGERQDDAYITESIKSPLAVVVEGFPPAMPTFPALSDGQIADLVAYLNTLN